MRYEKNKEFEKYFKAYYSKAVFYTIKKVAVKSDAEDIVMNAFFSCFSKFEEYNSEKASFATWFYFILNNKTKNYYRDTKVFEDADELKEYADVFEDEVADAFELAQLRDELASAILKLNEIQQKIVILKYFKNKNSTEISNILGISAGNVRIQLMRAMDKLRVLLRNH